MKVTFAYPRVIDGTEYAPDQTADIDDAVAKRELHDGFARRATTPRQTKAPATPTDKKEK